MIVPSLIIQSMMIIQNTERLYKQHIYRYILEKYDKNNLAS